MDTTVTYCPQDDKLRIYFASRQPDAVLAPLREAGFRWAGAQECWFAHWSPKREDVALATGADGIDDEPGTLEDRAEDRAERFTDYSGNAAKERDQRLAHDRQVCEQLNGQPILVGHHSEKRHRAMLARMWRNFMAAGEANKRADYWAGRAHSSLRFARFKDRADVRARRIKTLEAELRRFQRTSEQSQIALRLAKDDVPFAALLEFCNFASWGAPSGCWSALDAVKGQDAAAQAPVIAAVLERIRNVNGSTLANAGRWIVHLQGRIAYEKDQLAEAGATSLLEPKPRKVGKGAIPLRNVRLPGSVEMTAADYGKINKDYKATRVHHDAEGNAFRVRSAIVRSALCAVFLTDAKETP